MWKLSNENYKKVAFSLIQNVYKFYNIRVGVVFVGLFLNRQQITIKTKLLQSHAKIRRSRERSIGSASTLIICGKYIEFPRLDWPWYRIAADNDSECTLFKYELNFMSALEFACFLKVTQHRLEYIGIGRRKAMYSADGMNHHKKTNSQKQLLL